MEPPFSSLLRGSAGWLALTLAGCSTAAAGHPPPAAPTTMQAGARALHMSVPVRSIAPRSDAVVLLTLDGARWQEIFGGVDRTLAAHAHLRPEEIVTARELMPNLWARLVDRGVALGDDRAPISASGPVYISLPGYMELLSGVSTGCRHNQCARIGVDTLFDEVRDDGQPMRVDALAIGSWGPLARAISRRGGIPASTGRNGGELRDGLRVDDDASSAMDRSANAGAWPGDGDYRPDRLTGELALRVLSATRPRLAFVGLGDTDEHAHANDYRGYLHALHEADAFLGRLLDQLAAQGERGEQTTVLVTADHGRADDFKNHGSQPESARVFLVAAGGAARVRGVIARDREAHLADVAPTVRALLGLPAAPSDGAPIAEIVDDEG